MKALPIGLLLEGKSCVVVGAGKVAARKAAALLEAGARVKAVGKRFSAEFDRLAGVERVKGAYSRRHLKGAAVVVVATSDPAVNRAAARDARAEGALVNVVDTPGECDFIFPAVSRKGEISVAVSTGGASPALARRLKDKIAASVDDVYADLAAVLKHVRRRAIEGMPDPAHRRAFFEALASDEFLDLIKREGQEKALRAAEALLDAEITGKLKGNST